MAEAPMNLVELAKTGDPVAIRAIAMMNQGAVSQRAADLRTQAQNKIAAQNFANQTARANAMGEMRQGATPAAVQANTAYTQAAAATQPRSYGTTAADIQQRQAGLSAAMNPGPQRPGQAARTSLQGVQTDLTNRIADIRNRITPADRAVTITNPDGSGTYLPANVPQASAPVAQTVPAGGTATAPTGLLDRAAGTTQPAQAAPTLQQYLAGQQAAGTTPLKPEEIAFLTDRYYQQFPQAR